MFNKFILFTILLSLVVSDQLTPSSSCSNEYCKKLSTCGNNYRNGNKDCVQDALFTDIDFDQPFCCTTFEDFHCRSNTNSSSFIVNRTCIDKTNSNDCTELDKVCDIKDGTCYKSAAFELNPTLVIVVLMGFFRNPRYFH